MNDLRFAFRQLVKNPGFTAVAVLTLALGIGANTAIFSVVNTVLLTPLPYSAAERLVMICENNLKQGWKQNVVSPANYIDWKEQNTVFDKIAGVRFDNFNLSGVENPQRLMAAQITSNYFEVFGARPLIGRTFLAEEYEARAPRTVILSEGLWRRQFGSETNILGQAVMLNGGSHSVVGVMPSSFRFFHPTTVGGWPDGLRDAEVWRPMYLAPEQLRERNNHWWLVLARLKSGVSLAQAQSEMNTISRRIHQANPDYSDWGITVAAFHDQAVAHVRPALMALLAGVVCVLLIVCANLANLFLTRAITRQKEFAIRMALGSGRGPVLRQLIVESALIVLVGGAAGILLARWGISGLLAVSPADLPRAGEVGWDARVLGVTLLISAFTGLLFGFAPALGIFRLDLNRSLAESGRSGGSVDRSRFRNALVVSQVGLALMLLVAAGLLARSFWKLLQVDPGFKPDHLVAADISLVDRKYSDTGKRIEFARRLVEQVERLPGVESAATIYGLPLGSMLYGQFALEIEGRPAAAGQLDIAHVRQVSTKYFETMRMPLLRGRTFSESEKVDSPAVVVINQSMAAKYFPGENPLGRRISLGDGLEPAEIIGVVRDAKALGLDQPTPPEVFRSHSQCCDWYLSLVVRGSSGPKGMLARIRREISAIDPDRAVYNVRTMNEALAASVAARRFAMTLIGVFAVVALALSALGIYGVVSYSVSQRTREIGVRVALGAQHADVICLVLTQGLEMAFLGLLVGLAGTLVITRLVASQLFQVSPLDPLTITGTAVVLLLGAACACYLPARRATRVNPMEALRYE